LTDVHGQAENPGFYHEALVQHRHGEDGNVSDLDDPCRVHELRALIERKGALRRLYAEVYERYAACLARCPPGGTAIELGSGAGFVQSVLPDVVTSDTIPYEGVDKVVDATRMPFADGSLRGIFMLNVFHHIPDVAGFLREAERCLKPGGRVLIVDQFPGWFSSVIYKRLHHEPFRPDAKEWAFDSEGPLSGANGALAWIVFRRDRERFEAMFPKLNLERFEPHTPLRYWLSGGLKRWTLLPGFAFRLATWIDRLLVRISPGFASFVDIELVRVP
jgi:SAM-dependent methyltransferase